MHYELYARVLLGSISLFVINVPFATYAVINIIQFIYASRWLISGGLRWIDLRPVAQGMSVAPDRQGYGRLAPDARAPALCSCDVFMYLPPGDGSSPLIIVWFTFCASLMPSFHPLS